MTKKKKKKKKRRRSRRRKKKEKEKETEKEEEEEEQEEEGEEEEEEEEEIEKQNKSSFHRYTSKIMQSSPTFTMKPFGLTDGTWLLKKNSWHEEQIQSLEGVNQAAQPSEKQQPIKKILLKKSISFPNISKIDHVEGFFTVNSFINASCKDLVGKSLSSMIHQLHTSRKTEATIPAQSFSYKATTKETTFNLFAQESNKFRSDKSVYCSEVLLSEKPKKPSNTLCQEIKQIFKKEEALESNILVNYECNIMKLKFCADVVDSGKHGATSRDLTICRSKADAPLDSDQLKTKERSKSRKKCSQKQNVDKSGESVIH